VYGESAEVFVVGMNGDFSWFVVLADGCNDGSGGDDGGCAVGVAKGG
jgi:hypothetical protein